MTITLLTKAGKPTELKTSNMTDKEYVIVEKRFAEPKTGTGQNKDGAYEWRLYSLKLHEHKTMDDATEAMKVFTHNPAIEVSYFNNGKTFKDEFDKYAVGTRLKVTQYKKEGDAYRSFRVEVVNVETPSTNLNTRIAQLKKSGMNVDGVITTIEKEFDGTTPDSIKVIYNAI